MKKTEARQRQKSGVASYKDGIQSSLFARAGFFAMRAAHSPRDSWHINTFISWIFDARDYLDQYFSYDSFSYLFFVSRLALDNASMVLDDHVYHVGFRYFIYGGTSGAEGTVFSV